MNYAFHILTMIALYVILGMSLNLVVGYGGMLSLCHAAFYGSGAYAFTLLVVKAGWPFLAALPAAVIITALIAFLIGVVSLRLRGDFFVLASLGFQSIAFTTLYNWTDLTHGPYGISGIPRPEILGLRFEETWANLLVVIALTACVCFLMLRLTKQPFGRTLQAIRDDEIAAKSLGKDTIAFKRTAFMIGGALAAVAGALFASYSSYIDPTSFALDESVFILCVVIIGGAGNFRGPVVGASILVLLPELLRFVGLPNAIAANLRQIIYGLLLILMMRFRPQGIAGRYAFD